MLNIINESLCTFDPRVQTNPTTGQEYHKLIINTSGRISRLDLETNQSSRFVKTIASLTSVEKDYTGINLGISTRTNEYNKVSVYIKAAERNVYDANIFIVALPFNGIIKPIPVSKQYRIYNGVIMISNSYSVILNNSTYKKVLYLVIEPNMLLFKEDHKYHCDEIEIPFETYTTYNNKADPNSIPRTKYEKMTLKITADGHTVNWENKIIDYVDMSQYKGEPLYVTYKRPDHRNDGTAVESEASATDKPVVPISMRSSTFTQPQAASVPYERPPYRPRQNRNPTTYRKDDYDEPVNQKRHGNKGKKSKKRGY